MPSEHFIIAGAQRSGTTRLYRLCAEHPEIEMARPERPEPKFFSDDERYARGLAYYRAQFFAGKPGARVRGEKSTSYMEIEKAAQRIAASLPAARIVFVLRNPVERAVSNYWFSVANGLETLPIEEAFAREEERRADFDPRIVSVSPFSYLRRGRYIDYLRMYERYFPPERILVLIHERLIASDGPLRKLFAFLGVDPAFLPQARRSVVNANLDRPARPLDADLRGRLEAYFAEPNALLAERLGAPIPEWRPQRTPRR